MRRGVALAGQAVKDHVLTKARSAMGKDCSRACEDIGLCRPFWTGAAIMMIIDSQVHAYERNHPGRPWAGFLTGPDEVTGDAMVAAMEAVGVAGAVLVSPFSLYGYDASYALEVYRQHPGRFGLVKPVNPTDPAVAETIADWAATPGTIGIRLMVLRDASTDPADPGLNRVLAAAAQHAIPVNVIGTGRLEQVARLVARHPQTQVVIDHLGLPQ